MKFSIAWHKGVIENLKRHMGEELRRSEHLLDSIEKMKAEIAFRQYQIDEAVRLKKDGFDREKFRRLRPANVDYEIEKEE